EPKWNAWVELHNVIAAAASPHEFGPEARERIERERGINLKKQFLGERLQFYARYLRHLLSDGDLTGEQREELDHVTATLGLAPEDLAPVHERTFGRVAFEVAADARLGVRERSLLYKLQHALGLDPGLADAAYGLIAADRLRTLLTAVLADGLLTADEATELERAAHSLDVPIPRETARERVEGRAYAVLMRAGALPALPHEYAPLAYHPGEVLHVVAEVGQRLLYAHDFEGHSPETPFPRVRRGRLRRGLVAVTSHRLCLFPPDRPYREIPLDRVYAPTPFEGLLLLQFDGAASALLEGGSILGVLMAVLDRIPSPRRRRPRSHVALPARPAADATLPLFSVWVPPPLQAGLEDDEAPHLAFVASVARLDLHALADELSGPQQRLLDQLQTGGLTVGRRRALRSLGSRAVVVTDRRVLFHTARGQLVSLRYADLRRLLCFSDGVALEPESGPGWFVTGTSAPETLYALLFRLKSGG
ncbi:MAG TPA: hypothetical protein VK610_09125, partial [Rhodothermales bacterium]|nr:hypothetical protein [Rhodothermales bacterium]